MYTSPPLKIVCGPVFNVVHEHVTHFHCVVALEQPLLNIRCLLLLISMLWHRQAIFESKGDKLSSSAECRIRTWKSQDTYSPADWMPTHKPTELSRIKLKTWTQQPVPMMSEHSAHLTSLPFGFRTWLWRYTCLLLLISMLWHRQAIFESKGDNCLPLMNAGFEPGSLKTPIHQQTECSHFHCVVALEQPLIRCL